MKRLLAAAVLLFLSISAEAATLEMLPGSAPQTTRSGAFFPATIGVILRDDAGVPIEGASVYFYDDEIGGANVSFFSINGIVATTDANGVVAFTASVLGGYTPGEVRLRVYSSGAQIFFPPLTVLPGPPTRLVPVAGEGQFGQVGELFASGWSALALGADDLPVPYAWVMFDMAGVPGESYGTFPNGLDYVSVMADANGVATSPRALAGPVTGPGQVSACAPGMGCPNFNFVVVSGPLASSAVAVVVPPLSIEAGTLAPAPFVFQVFDAMGVPLANVPVTYTTFVECGRFDGALDATVLSDNAGLATAPRFFASGAGFNCPVWVTVQGIGRVAEFIIYEFRPEEVVIDAPSVLSVRQGQRFTVRAGFRGLYDVPLYPAPLQLQVTSAPNGASATLVREPIVTFTDTEVLFEFTANSRSGHYSIVIQKGPVQKVISVHQQGK